MYLLDTNICIDFVDGRSEVAKRRVQEGFRSGIGISAITAGELLVGARGSADPVEDTRRIERFIEVVRCHDFDEAAARHYATIAKQIGVRRKSFDRLIAAHAMALGFVLVTNNVKHFADVEGLKVENWIIE
jgi:tRNA(fMet)-specific endonuclease VapC